MTKIFVFFFIVISSFTLSAQKEQLEILSWNVFLRPLLSDNQNGRVDSIASYLNGSNADILVLQEVFHRKTRKRLIKVLSKEYPEHTHVGPTSFIGISSGVMIFSKHKIVDEAHVSFRKAKGIDGIAKKGGVAAIIKFANRKIKIVGTHLQAGGGSKKNDVRAKQINCLKELFPKKKVSATIYAGDFNTKVKSSEFETLLISLDCKNDVITGKNNYTANFNDHDLFESEGPPEWIDFILLSQSSSGTYVKSFIDEPFCLINDKISRISDHNPIRSIISFKRH